VSWTVEAIAGALIAAGLALGWRGTAARGDAPPRAR
jgi:hypothetical protein